MTDKKRFVCDCPGPCGVDRDYGQIWQDFQAKHGRTYDHPGETRRIHLKWKSLGKQATNGGIRNMTGV